MKTRYICFLLISALLLFPCSTSLAEWNGFRNEMGLSQANTTSSQTPTDTLTSGLKWSVTLPGDTGLPYVSTSIITENSVYVTNRNQLHQLDKNGTLQQSLTLAGSINSVCQMTRNKERLFIPLAGGQLQCVDIHTMTSVWQSESFGNQSLSTVYFHNDCVYAATTNGLGTDGLYYCLDANTGDTLWTFQDNTNPCGYYWSGAISVSLNSGQEPSAPTESLLFGGDNGILISHSLTDDTIYDRYDLSALTGSSKGKLRAGITYDVGTDACYTTSNNGYLYQIRLAKDGDFDSVQAVYLGTPSSALDMNCTSTPTIYNGRIYVGSYYDGAGQLTVIDAETMTVIYRASSSGIGEIKSSPLVSTGYATDANHQRVLVYFSSNAVPGGIYYIEDDSQATSADIKTLYTPKNKPQFCMSSIAADTDGTLYYSNDSGTLFAVAEGYAENDIAPTKTPAPTTPAPTMSPPTMSPSLSGTTSGTTDQTTLSVKKPRNLRCKIKRLSKNKYKVTLRWTKPKKAIRTQIKIKKKTYASTKRNSYTLRLKKGSYTICLYSVGSQGIKSKAAKLRITVTGSKHKI